jgi:hypothetical protein
MPIAINGSGTITGISAGGLPDGVITTDDIAAAAVTSAKLASGTGGKILQVVRAETTANTSGSAIIPRDNTIPQNTEGFEVLTCSITPVSASSKLYIVSTIYAGETSNATNDLCVALFRDSAAGAFAANFGIIDVNAHETGAPLYTSAYINSSSTSSTTIKARIGTSALGTLVLNIATGGTRTFPVLGGVYASSITIMEVAQ